MKDGGHISQEDMALYAMQALSAEESAAVRRHLANCETCRAELGGVSGDLALVAMSVEQHPLPAGARERFLDRIGAAAGGRKAEQPVAAISGMKARPARRIAAWIPWVAAAVLAGLAVFLGVRVHLLNEKLEEQTALADARAVESEHAREVLEVLTAPSAQRVELTATSAPPQPSARAVYLASRAALILQASNLKALPQDKTYELWVIPANGAAPVAAGLFRPDASGSASVVLPRIPAGIAAKAFGVTIEKAGGTEKPTLPIILSGAAPAGG